MTVHIEYAMTAISCMDNFKHDFKKSNFNNVTKILHVSNRHYVTFPFESFVAIHRRKVPK
jgi:hypothetical protein